jgi:CRISPR system Cascade subunit CasE
MSQQMHLSKLTIATRGRAGEFMPGRHWLRNIYRVHQRLCMAFPSKERKARDPEFLAPYEPNDFICQVNARRGEKQGFLFRIDHADSGPVSILVLSAIKPDWDYAFHNARQFLAEPPLCRPFDQPLVPGGKYVFRLRASPTKTQVRHDLRVNGKRQGGRHIPIIEHGELCVWLRRKIDEAGGTLLSPVDPPDDTGDGSGMPPLLLSREGIRKVRDGKSASRWKPEDDGDETSEDDGREPNRQKQNDLLLRTVSFEGILEVRDPAKLEEALRSGIGRGKAFGCGLLSLARA